MPAPSCNSTIRPLRPASSGSRISCCQSVTNVWPPSCFYIYCLYLFLERLLLSVVFKDRCTSAVRCGTRWPLLSLVLHFRSACFHSICTSAQYWQTFILQSSRPSPLILFIPFYHSAMVFTGGHARSQGSSQTGLLSFFASMMCVYVSYCTTRTVLLLHARRHHVRQLCRRNHHL
jgi:hypothetical protein